MHDKTRHRSAEFVRVQTRGAIVDPCEHPGVVNFEHCVRETRKWRQTPGSLSESTRKEVLFPKIPPRTAAAAALMVEWPDMYSGCAAVTPSRGVQSRSVSVAGFPSRSAF